MKTLVASASEKDIIIMGLTEEGKTFRPSDWADRLCGVLNQFIPVAHREINAHLRYSHFVCTALLDGVKSVVIAGELDSVAPLAYEFGVNFAKNNHLQLVNACFIPEAHKPQV